MMIANRQIAVIAPEQMASAFSVLIHSAPNLNLLASATDLDRLRSTLCEAAPDGVLVYLVQEIRTDSENNVDDIITRIKTHWPGVLCIAIVKYASQLEKAKESGADIALVDGVSAERVLAALEGKSK
jgi:hypothetical protein